MVPSIAELIGSTAASMIMDADALLMDGADGSLGKVSLSDYAGKYVAILFYPTNFSFVCPTEITAFSDRVGEFEKRNCQILACSTESKFSHLAWSQEKREKRGVQGLTFPIISDQNKLISKSFGLVKDETGLACRCLVLVDGKSIIRHVTVNDFPVGRSVDEVLRIIDAFQHFERYGEVCPADWTKGNADKNPAFKATI